jgi:transcriptional regulator with XRE-family HTH domain
MPSIPQLRAIREARCLSQAELAERAGVRQATVSHAESGAMVQYATIRKLARALRVKASALMGTADNTLE